MVRATKVSLHTERGIQVYHVQNLRPALSGGTGKSINPRVANLVGAKFYVPHAQLDFSECIQVSAYVTVLVRSLNPLTGKSIDQSSNSGPRTHLSIVLPKVCSTGLKLDTGSTVLIRVVQRVNVNFRSCTWTRLDQTTKLGGLSVGVVNYFITTTTSV